MRATRIIYSRRRGSGWGAALEGGALMGTHVAPLDLVERDLAAAELDDIAVAVASETQTPGKWQCSNGTVLRSPKPEARPGFQGWPGRRTRWSRRFSGASVATASE